MKQICFLGLCLLMLANFEALGQISIPRRKVVQNQVISQTDGKLNYIVENGNRKTFRMAADLRDTMAMPFRYETLFISIVFSPPIIRDDLEKYPSENDFAQEIKNLAVQGKSPVRIYPEGENIVYEFKGGLLIAAKRGTLSYVIKDGVLTSYDRPRRPFYNSLPWIYQKMRGLFPQTIPFQPSFWEQASKDGDENDFAQYYGKMLVQGWRVVFVSANSKETIYYLEK